MKIVGFVVEAIVTAILACLAAVAATWLWNAGIHGTPLAEWHTAARLGILLGVTLPVTRRVAQPRRGRPATGC